MRLGSDLKTGVETPATSWFSYTKASPNAPLETPAPLAADISAAAESKSAPLAAGLTAGDRSTADYSGVWKRDKCMNVEAYVGVQGAGYMQRKLVASVSMTHTITMDPQLRAVRIQEKAGPIDTDYTLIIGAPAVKNEVMKKVFLDRSNMRQLHSLDAIYDFFSLLMVGAIQGVLERGQAGCASSARVW